jgi:hypothetical protein
VVDEGCTGALKRSGGDRELERHIVCLVLCCSNAHDAPGVFYVAQIDDSLYRTYESYWEGRGQQG